MYVAPTTGLEHPADCPWRVVARPEDGVSAFTVGRDTIYLVAHCDAPRRRVLAVPLAGGEPSVFVPESDRVVEAVRIAGEHLLIRELDGAAARLRRVALAGGEAEEVTLPVAGTIREWASAPGSPGLLLGIESWTGPLRHYRYQAGSGVVVPAQVGPASHDTGAGTAAAGGLFAGVEAYQVFAVARDGTPVPVSLVHRRGLAERFGPHSRVRQRQHRGRGTQPAGLRRVPPGARRGRVPAGAADRRP
ncbi:MAG TPA: hypothetical protein VFM54_18110 [Micromonosporaceae bacterium]|nr:hypothetical protein [Micromonosporaceae bacterium]